MPDHNEVIDFRSFFHQGRTQVRTVDGSASTDFNVVFQNNGSVGVDFINMVVLCGHLPATATSGFYASRLRGHIAETIRTDTGVVLNGHAIANLNTLTNTIARVENTIFTHNRLCTDGDMRHHHGTGTHLGMVTYERKRTNRGIG